MTSTHSERTPTARLPARPSAERQRLIRTMNAVYVTRREDALFAELSADLVDRTLAEREGRALIVAGPSGAGKTTLIRHGTRAHPELSITPDEHGAVGMLFVQVPPACNLADLGTAVAQAAGYPARDGLKASVAWGAAMRVIKEKGIRFLWIDELQNVTELANVKEARKIRNTIKMSLINVRHSMGLVLSGDMSIVSFLCSDRHILRRSDVMEIAAVDASLFAVIAGAIKLMARKAGMSTAPELETEIVPRLVHAALGQFGTSIETARITIARAADSRDDASGAVAILDMENFARSWARAHAVGADANPFVTPLWAKLDVAAILAPDEDLVPAKGRRR